jgi:hypothetical protein
MGIVIDWHVLGPTPPHPLSKLLCSSSLARRFCQLRENKGVKGQNIGNKEFSVLELLVAISIVTN